MHKNSVRLLVALILASSGAGAQDYPQREIQLIVPFEPGGAVDTTSRIIAEAANRIIEGSRITVVNRSGGGGIVGQTFAARAAPDGYTILAMTSSVVTNPRLKGASYTIDDFTPVALYNVDPEVIAVSTNSPYKTIDQLVAAAEERKPNMVTAGMATTHHMAGLAIEKNTDIRFNYLPVRGFGGQLQAVMGNHADGGFWPLGEAASHAKGGTIRILAVAAESRDDRFPHVPTFLESGFKVPLWASFRGWAVPAGTPDEAVRYLSDLLQQVNQSSEYQGKMQAAGYRVVFRDADEFRIVVNDYTATTDAIIEAHGLGLK